MNERQRHEDRDLAAKVGEGLFHFRRGMEAGKQGRLPTENPHPPGSPAAKSWNYGWLFGLEIWNDPTPI